MHVEHLQKRLVEEGLGRWAWPIAESAQPAIKITVVYSDEKLIPPGVSKFGGTPHVPTEFRWPQSASGSPLSFVAQIRFADVMPFQWMGWKPPLPEDGLVSFFIDPNAEIGPESVRTYYFPEPKSLVRWEDPYALDSPRRRQATDAGAPDDGAVKYPPRSLAFQQCLSLPGIDSQPIQSIGMERDEPDQFTRFARRHNHAGGRHQLLGYPDGAVTGPDQTLLLQLDSDPLLGWDWPGAGVLRFGMRSADFDAGRFDRVTAI